MSEGVISLDVRPPAQGAPPNEREAAQAAQGELDASEAAQRERDAAEEEAAAEERGAASSAIPTMQGIPSHPSSSGRVEMDSGSNQHAGSGSIDSEPSSQSPAVYCCRVVHRLPVVSTILAALSAVPHDGHDPDLDPVDVRGVRPPRFLYGETMYHKPAANNTWEPAPDVELRYRQFNLNLVHKVISVSWFCMAMLWSLR